MIWTPKVDGVDKILAAHINALQTGKVDSDGTVSFVLPASVPGNTYGIYEGPENLIRAFEPAGGLLRGIFIGKAGNSTMGGGVGLGCKVWAFGDNACISVTTGNALCAFGQDVLMLNTTGDHNAGFGDYVLAFNVIGIGNCGFGTNALRYAVADYNNAFGNDALQNNIGGVNCAFGTSAMKKATTATGCAAFGNGALFENLVGNNNTALGVGAFYFLTGSQGIAVGFHAGIYETTQNNKFYLDCIDRGDLAGGKVKSLMYGIFDAVAANQFLRFNAQINMTVVAGPFANNAAALTGGCGVGDLYYVTGTDPRQVAIAY